MTASATGTRPATSSQNSAPALEQRPKVGPSVHVGATVALDDTHIPPESVARVARRSMKRSQAKPPSQRAMTPVGRRRRSQLSNRQPVSIRTLRRSLGYLSRHLVDKQGSTWDDYGKGREAWDGWGGDEMVRWASRILRREDTEWFTKWAQAPRNRRLLRHVGR